MPFDGVTYDREQDGPRLLSQRDRVLWVYCDGRWHTLFEAQDQIREEFEVEDSLTGISARVRDFRKEKFGGFTVESRRRTKGTWEYRIVT
jgi:hypothetical protein